MESIRGPAPTADIKKKTKSYEELEKEVERQTRELSTLTGRIIYEREKSCAEIDALKLSLALALNKNSQETGDRSEISISQREARKVIKKIADSVKRNMSVYRVLFFKKTLLKAIFTESGVVDEKWYLANNEDVASQRLDPIDHYVRHGIWEERASRASL